MLKKEPQARLLKKSGKIRKDNKVCYSPYSVSTHSIFWCLNMGFINTAIFVEENSKVCWNFNNYYRLRHQLSLNKENKNKSKQKTFFPINISKPPNKFVEKKKNQRGKPQCSQILTCLFACICMSSLNNQENTQMQSRNKNLI